MSLNNSDESIYCLSHILIPKHGKKISDKNIVKNVINLNEKLKKNSTLFGIVARKISSCPSGKDNSNFHICMNSINAKNTESFEKEAVSCIQQYGGDLGCNKLESFVPEFSQGIKDLKVGQISDKPIETRFGYHIVKRY